MTPILIFDLDGTLIDSALDIHAASARLLQREGLDPLSLEVIRSFVGNGVPTLIDRIIAATDLPADGRTRYVESFLEDYEMHATDLTVPYSGVVEVLDAYLASGYKMGVCTNKPYAPTVKILKDLDLERFFSGVVGGDSYPERKPDPTGLLALGAELGAGPVLFIGDSEVDAETADRAKLPFLLFTEGYRKTPVEDLIVRESFSDFSKLPTLIEELLAETA
ncbi:phosphoglycolate phosphatase, bacterial [Roseibium sp. TrichSKD4]|uniref:HAD-IA family hydrolase n=1 Tax=Roseibium sp. TrichSKD4 TaxID=744980 RepID=UPI0001E57423|nr:HAD-IA family hydrolase [Roseibium sp. TrichSKD4]EFO29861.1 phosphoglycolate phosphatase, bacterial [Roseibium sp. TrichSKD4]